MLSAYIQENMFGGNLQYLKCSLSSSAVQHVYLVFYVLSKASLREISAIHQMYFLCCVCSKAAVASLSHQYGPALG